MSLPPYPDISFEMGELEKENKKLKDDNRFLTKICKKYMEKESIVEISEFTELYKDDLEKENENLKENISNLKAKCNNVEQEIRGIKRKLDKIVELFNDGDEADLLEYISDLCYDDE